MSSSLVFELLAGFIAACLALWFVAQRFSRTQHQLGQAVAGLHSLGATYVLRPGLLASVGLFLLRLSIGVMMIHHGQEKLADPQQFASTYVASLHLPFPLFFAYAAGLSELIGSGLLIVGCFTPLGAMALTGTMAVAAYQHILTAGFNIYVLELVTLYLGGSLAILMVGPGRLLLDAALVTSLLSKSTGAQAEVAPGEFANPTFLSSALQPIAIQSESRQ